MKAIKRIYQYFEYKNIKPTVFEKQIGLSSGYFSIQNKRNADIGESAMVKIIDNCQDLSIEWVLTGKGNMINKSLELESPSGNSNEKDLIILSQAKRIMELENQIATLKKEGPRITYGYVAEP